MKSTTLVTRQTRLYGLALLALLFQGCASTPEESTALSKEPPATSVAASGSSRRIFAHCEPAEAVKQTAGMVGDHVLITWAWNNASDRVASLEVPAVVLRVDSPYVVVAFDKRIPNLEFYSAIWLNSGHIKAMPDGAFGVDPCSATLKQGQW